MKEKIESLSSNYYEVEYSIENKGNNYFVGEAIVIRKDTNEVTRYGCVKYGSDINDIENKIFDSINKISSLLSMQPEDWNSNVRDLLAMLNSLQQYETGFLIGLGNNSSNNELEEFLQMNYATFLDHLIEETKNLILGIESLNKHDRKKLLSSDEETYNNPNDAWNLDDMSLRNQIFKFFIKPSNEEVELHNIHIERFKCLY